MSNTSGHQQLWYWLHTISRFLSSPRMGKEIRSVRMLPLLVQLEHSTQFPDVNKLNRVMFVGASECVWSKLSPHQSWQLSVYRRQGWGEYWIYEYWKISTLVVLQYAVFSILMFIILGKTSTRVVLAPALTGAALSERHMATHGRADLLSLLPCSDSREMGAGNHNAIWRH